MSLTQEYLAAGKLDDPPVILRKLFERLGATYIKLGQFIASSPSLFPEEYVLEFQKCLDQTEPVPFSRIKRTIEEELPVPIDQVRCQASVWTSSSAFLPLDAPVEQITAPPCTVGAL